MIVELNLCNKCNGYCPYCPYKDPNKFHQMSGEVFNRVMEICKDSNITQVNIGGYCEPTYHTNLTTFVSRLVPNVRVDLSTNGTNIYVLFELLKHDMDFSIHRLGGQDDLYYTTFNVLTKTLDLSGTSYHINDHKTMTKLSRCGLLPQLKDGCLEVETDHSYITDRLTIDYNGDVLLCCNDWSKYKFGNIMVDDLRDIRNRKYNYLSNMRRECDPETNYPCFKCEHGIERI